ncbi:galactonate dehydratase [Frigidibacter sp. ROC022]|uniref:galactonate dehydratase n=1 Tax=Frigidibacter sp. ROC022 TaxID=2971796 RepID=UPI00215B4CAF|nr:galactonate dehydratase [Frigidibacter sp. ROC022]MCR8723120.1 galactonate dehydratase [Frigidibacter sp. ROC022]
MKITAIHTQVVNARLRNWIFVQVETDVPGLFGLGEATLEFQTRAVVGAIEDLSLLILGQDPRNIEHLWQIMFRHPFFKGGIVTMSALSGIDQALHDLKAKDLGIPLWQLLGGLTRDRLRMYDHLGGGSSDAVYDDALPASFAEKAAQSRAEGFTAVKILAVGRTAPLDGLAALTHAEDLMAAAREGAGDDMDIMVDLHGRTTAAMAIQYAAALAPYRPWFIEEPCQPESWEGTAQVARSTAIPIAAGERLVHRREFLPLLQSGAIAIAQPDVCHAGGLTEVRRIAALCDTFGVSMAPHNPLGPIATMVNIHMGFATPNFLIQEVMKSDVPWRDEIVSGVTPIVDGHVVPSQAPGIGVEIDFDAAARHPYVDVQPPQWFHPDGSVADW